MAAWCTRSSPAIRVLRTWKTAASRWVRCRTWAARWPGPSATRLLTRIWRSLGLYPLPMSVSRDDILKALDQVIDPASGRTVVQQDMIQGLVVKEGHVGFVLEV